jgi:8-amino-7-oxononanoate synthase
MAETLMARLQRKLADKHASNLYRQRRIVDSPQQVELQSAGRPLLSFCSNDYLGLANHPHLARALKRGVDRWGVGSGAAHLINGHSRAHHALEQALAEFTGYPRAPLFSTGYMANLGLAQALVGMGDTVLEDRLNHASLLDGGLLSGARMMRYPHNAAEDLDTKLAGRTTGEKLVLTDGVFSMDGDIAEIPALANTCQKHGAWLMVDDAHGFGVLGANGRGTLEHHGVATADVPIYMATLGKALGTAGAFIAGSDELVETLIQKARTYIYSTASPPAVAEATRASLNIIKSHPELRGRLKTTFITSQAVVSKWVLN